METKLLAEGCWLMVTESLDDLDVEQTNEETTSFDGYDFYPDAGF